MYSVGTVGYRPLIFCWNPSWSGNGVLCLQLSSFYMSHSGKSFLDLGFSTFFKSVPTRPTHLPPHPPHQWWRHGKPGTGRMQFVLWVLRVPSQCVKIWFLSITCFFLTVISIVLWLCVSRHLIFCCWNPIWSVNFFCCLQPLFFLYVLTQCISFFWSWILTFFKSFPHAEGMEARNRSGCNCFFSASCARRGNLLKFDSLLRFFCDK